MQNKIVILACAALLASCNVETPKENEKGKGIDVSLFDTTVKPTDNFFQFINGTWIKNNPIPASEGTWGSFGELKESNQKKLKEILESSMNSNPAKGSNEQKIGDLFFTGMDSAKLEKDGMEPLKPYLSKIEEIKSIGDLQNMLAWFHSHRMGPAFIYYVDIDAKKSDQYISTLVQGGLGLPERDYYFREDEGSKKLREAYASHLENTFKLTGDDDATAKKNAAAVINIETSLAKTSMTVVERRDPEKQYNKKNIAELKKLVPNVNWENYFKSIGAEGISEVIVAQPKFFENLNSMLKSVSLDKWKTYLKWNLVRETSDYLSSNFVNQNFSFYGKVLSGTPELKPRWKRSLEQVDFMLGDALGKVFVDKYFPESSKKRVNEMVDNLFAAYRERIKTRDWMSDSTKQQALAKLDAIMRKLGFPDKWKDYSSVEISRDSYLGNILNCVAFEFNRNIKKLGAPVDRTEWGMSTPTINAYYNPSMNEIVFPAGIMQPPFFNPEADDAINYGCMGAVIGHELTHGFDDQGCRFNATGNMVNWWKKEDKKKFDAKTAKVVKQFNDFVAIDTLHVNGQLTLGENIADLGGMTMAYYALKKSLEGKTPEKIDGYTPEQRFFMGWAQGWRVSFRPEALKKQVLTNEHAPGQFRVLGPMSNMKEFYEAWGVKEGDGMWRPDSLRAEIW